MSNKNATSFNIAIAVGRIKVKQPAMIGPAAASPASRAILSNTYYADKTANRPFQRFLIPIRPGC
jgi:hypothetical protein